MTDSSQIHFSVEGDRQLLVHVPGRYRAVSAALRWCAPPKRQADPARQTVDCSPMEDCTGGSSSG